MNEKTFLTISPYNKIAGIEHDGYEQTDAGCLFNMILQDDTRSDNPFTWSNGELYKRYDYFLPQNTRITKVTIYYDYIICGFRFHLSDGSTWCIGEIGDW